MDRLKKLFVKSKPSFNVKKSYSNLLARKYPDLTPEEADKKVVKNITQMQQLPLTEMPIDQFQTIGDFSKGSSFTKKTDRAILTSPKAVQKIKDKFANTNQAFDMYFVNSKEGRVHKEVGEVQEDFIRNELKLDTPINDNNITVFYTNNTGDKGVMMTAWIIAHRFGHVVRKLPGWHNLCREVNETIQRLMQEAYEKPMKLSKDGVTLGSDFFEPTGNLNEKILKNFYHQIGTFKSARDKKLNTQYEFMYELLAQYLTSKISFNPLPKYIPVKYAWGKPVEGVRFTGPDGDLDYYQSYLRNLEESFADYAEYLLGDCVGKIFVM